jgi:GNAT superfamily N-acetyltransferase
MLAQWRFMTEFEPMTAADVPLMQGLAQRVTAVRPDMISAGASYGELSWIWGKDSALFGDAWRRRLWHVDGELVAFAWAMLPHRKERNDGSVIDVESAELIYQIHPDHTHLADEVISWFDDVADGLERTVLPTDAEKEALQRWAAHGYVSDEDALAENGWWTQLNARTLDEIEEPVLPEGFTFRTADEVGPEAAVGAIVAAWQPTTFSELCYAELRKTAAYRGDLHVLVEAPDERMAASTIIWFDSANKTIEFEPVGTHPDFRRLGLARSMMLDGMRRAKAAGAAHATVVCMGAPGRPAAKATYYGLGFREISRDVPLIKR